MYLYVVRFRKIKRQQKNMDKQQHFFILHTQL